MRLFIAVDLPEEVKNELGRVPKQSGLGKITYVKPENIHLTLKFLGEVDEGNVEKIKQKLEEPV